LSAAEDEENQKRGQVGIAYYLGGEFKCQFNHELNQKVAQMAKWFPLKLHALHICFNNQELRTWKPLALFLLGKKIRLRARIHDGSPFEVKYSLMTFGIPIDVLPMNAQGEVKTNAHLKWIQKRRSLEEQYFPAISTMENGSRGGTSNHGNGLNVSGGPSGGGSAGGGGGSGGIIDMPAKWDVILRRGRIYQGHPGNIRMRQLMETYLADYSKASLKQKNEIVWKIIHELQHPPNNSGQGSEPFSDGGVETVPSTTEGTMTRFLEVAPQGWWVQVDLKDVSRRLAKSIRSFNAKKQQEQQEAPGTTTTKTATTRLVTSSTSSPFGAYTDEDEVEQQHIDKKARAFYFNE
jgi:hypothetical protein